jgi:hypothetical protein
MCPRTSGRIGLEWQLDSTGIKGRNEKPETGSGVGSHPSPAEISGGFSRFAKQLGISPSLRPISFYLDQRIAR